jgi:DNA (cytosine-5)-methyltransferase 1
MNENDNTLRVLNLYAGIGGNRKLWKNVDVVAAEINPKIANIYQDFFPNDQVIVCDAHQYLLEHFNEFDFIWSSPPCQSHSDMYKMCALSNDFKTGNSKKIVKYPDMKLYEEILLLKHYFKGKWCVENVMSYYAPLIKPQTIQRHFFWTNFFISIIDLDTDNIKWGRVKFWQKRFGFDLSTYHIDKRKVLRNCVHPILGQHIFNYAFKEKQMTLEHVIDESVLI